MKRFKLIAMGILILMMVASAWIAGVAGSIALSLILVSLSVPFFLIYFTVVIPLRWSKTNV